MSDNESDNELVRDLVDRATDVGERLLAHGLDQISIEVRYQGRSKTQPDRMSIELRINANPGIMVTALELLADTMDIENHMAFASPGVAKA